MYGSWLDLTPLWALFCGAVLTVAGSIFVGLRIGNAMRHKGIKESVGTTVGAALGLLAFMLGFTFNMTADRFDVRKQLFINEISAISTSYLRAGFLPAPYDREIRQLLRDYVRERTVDYADQEALQTAIKRSETIHQRMWSLIEIMNHEQPLTMAAGLLVRSLNEVIDLHTQRVVVGLQFRIPSTIWIGLFAVTLLTMMLVGYQCAQQRQKQHAVNAVLAIIFAAVVTLIMDLDRAASGSGRVNQQPWLDLQSQLETWPVTASPNLKRNG